jgi:hypothetical protein
MSHKATRVTVGGFDLVQFVGAVLLALVGAFVVLGGYEFVSALDPSLPVTATAPAVATLVFTLFLVATVVALRRLRLRVPSWRRRSRR